MGYQFLFDEEKCTGCYACHTACIGTHPECEAQHESLRTIRKVVKKAAGYQKNICPGCIHCGACERVCPTQAIYREEQTGLILVGRSRCTGCRTCEGSCPQQVIHFDISGKMVKCDGCIQRLHEGREPACVRNCHTGAIAVKER